MTEGLKGVAGLIEIGTVTIQTGTDMRKMHLAIEDGGIGILILVEMKHVGMNQIDTIVLDGNLPWFLGFFGFLRFLGIS